MSSELCREFDHGPPRHVRAIRSAARKIDAEYCLRGTVWTSRELAGWPADVAGISDGLHIAMRDDIETPAAAAVIWVHEYSHVCALQRGGELVHGHTWVFAAMYAYFLARLGWLQSVLPLWPEMVHHCEDDQLAQAWAEGAAGLGPSWSMAARAADIGGRCWTHERLGGDAAMRTIIDWYCGFVRGFFFVAEISFSPPRPTFFEKTSNCLKSFLKNLKDRV